MKKIKNIWMLVLALVFVLQGIPAARAEVIQNLTVDYLFEGLGDAVNYGVVAREWEQQGHAETTACVDWLEKLDHGQVFVNSTTTYEIANGYRLQAEVTAPAGVSLNEMSFALYKEGANGYERCANTLQTISTTGSSATLTWSVDDDLRNSRLYVFQTNGDGYVENGKPNGSGLVVTYGPSISAAAQNNNYFAKIITRSQADILNFLNTFDHTPAFIFGPETRLYSKSGDTYTEINPNDKTLNVEEVYINYYQFTGTDEDFDPATDQDKLTKKYAKFNDMKIKNGVLGKEGKNVQVVYVNDGSYADTLLDRAERLSYELGNMGGGKVTSLTPNPAGGSTVTGPVSEDGYVVSLYEAKIGDNTFIPGQDMDWEGIYSQSQKYGIPVSDKEYVVINVVCPSAAGEVVMGGADAFWYYYMENGEVKYDSATWNVTPKDSGSSQHVIYNFVYEDNGVMRPFEGTIVPQNSHGGTLLAPRAYVNMRENVHNGAMLVNKVNNGQEIHQRTIMPLNRSTWVRMNGGYIKLNKVASGYNWSDNTWYVSGPLEDAVFGVYSSSDCSKGSLVTTMTTDAQGVALSEILPAGTYWVKEIEAPGTHVIVTKNPLSVVVVAGQTVTLAGPGDRIDPNSNRYGDEYTVGEGKFVNRESENIKVKLRVEKIDAETLEPIRGAVFAIYSTDDSGAQIQVGTMTTNQNGVAVSDDLTVVKDWSHTDDLGNQHFTNRKFWVQEIQAPDGYVIDNNDKIEINTQNFEPGKTYTVDGNGSASGIAFTNTALRGHLKIEKVSQRKNAPLAGAEFTVYKQNNAGTLSEEVCKLTTGADGKATTVGNSAVFSGTGLHPGIYYVQETKAPDGHYLSDPNPVYKVQVKYNQTVKLTEDPIVNEAYVRVVGQKKWYDQQYSQNVRPASVKIQLYRVGKHNPNEFVEEKEIRGGNDDTPWTFEFDNLPYADEDGKPYTYFIREYADDSYYSWIEFSETDQDGNMALVIGNTVKKTYVEGKKNWTDDDDDPTGKPDSITYVLYMKKGNEVVQFKDHNNNAVKVTANRSNNYAFKFNDLPTFDVNGETIEYVVLEQEDASFEQLTDMSTNTDENLPDKIVQHITLVNRRMTSLTGTKTWDDNADNTRPDGITLIIKANGSALDPQPEITSWTKEGNVWTWESGAVPVYDDAGHKIVYTVEESPVPADYQASYDGLNVTNTLNTDKTNITVTKVWDDNNNAAGLRPESITVQLLADGIVMTGKDAVLPHNNTWTYTWTGLDKFVEVDGTPREIIVYTVQEKKVPTNYKATVDGFTIINALDETKTWVKVKKVWAPAGEGENHPQSVTVWLMNGEVPLESVVLNAENQWQHIWMNLDKTDANGNVIAYTVAEDQVEGYEVPAIQKVSDTEFIYVITNTKVKEKTSVTVRKVWAPNDGTVTHPEEVTVQLKAGDIPVTAEDGTVKLNAGNNWSYTWTDLDKTDANGNVIAYTVAEENPPVGYTPNVTANPEGSFNFTLTNKYTVETTEFTVSKTWADENLPHPAKVTVTLMKNGTTEVGTVELNEENGWRYTWTGLAQKDKNGNVIVYTVKETAIEGYVCTPTNTGNGCTLTNHRDAGKTSVRVSKAWAPEGIVHTVESVSVSLLADEQPVETTPVELNAGNEWKYEWTELPVYKYDAVTGEASRIAYTVEEVNPPVGYTPNVTANPEGSFDFTLTNTRVEEGASCCLTMAATKTITGTAKTAVSAPKFKFAVFVNDEEVAEGWNNNDGQIEFAEIKYTLEDIGKKFIYKIKEIQGESQDDTFDYVNWDSTVFTVEVEVILTPDGKVSHTDPVYRVGESYAENIHFSNQVNFRTGSLALKKVDSENPAIGLEGAQFGIFADPDSPTPLYTITTDDKGEAVQTGLNVGTYYVKELVSPAGYVSSDTKYTVQVKADETVMVNAENGGYITNQRAEVPVHLTSITVRKVWEGAAGGEIELILFADGVVMNPQPKPMRNGDAYTYVGLPMYDMAGKLVVYTVKEAALDGYTTTYRNNAPYADVTDCAHNGGVIVNKKQEVVVPEYLTSITVRKVWEGAAGGEIELILFADGVMMNPQPKPVRNGDAYTYAGLPMYDAAGKLITYTVQETTMANYTTVYQNPAPYADVTHCAYNGGVIVNQELTRFAVRKVWSGLKADETAPAVKLLLYCNGVLCTDVTPVPTADGWYVYHNLPAMVNGVKAVYSVVEASVDGWMTVYTNTGDYADDVDRAYDGGTILNTRIPQTGDHSHQPLWIAMLVLVLGGWIALRMLGRKWGVN